MGVLISLIYTSLHMVYCIADNKNFFKNFVQCVRKGKTPLYSKYKQATTTKNLKGGILNYGKLKLNCKANGFCN